MLEARSIVHHLHYEEAILKPKMNIKNGFVKESSVAYKNAMWCRRTLGTMNHNNQMSSREFNHDLCDMAGISVQNEGNLISLSPTQSSL